VRKKGEEGEDDGMSRELRIGLIGYDKAGLQHAAAMRKSEDAQSVAVADPAPAAAWAARELGVPCLPRYEDLLTEVDVAAVAVSLPHHLLHAAALLAAERGTHVLLEKPIGLTVAEAVDVVRAAMQACG
jgi:predicted dehydrogenase